MVARAQKTSRSVCEIMSLLSGDEKLSDPTCGAVTTPSYTHYAVGNHVHRLCGGSPPPSQGQVTIIVMVDSLTKLAHFASSSSLPTAKETAAVVLENVFRLHGLPRTILSDRGSQFTSQF